MMQVYKIMEVISVHWVSTSFRKCHAYQFPKLRVAGSSPAGIANQINALPFRVHGLRRTVATGWPFSADHISANKDTVMVAQIPKLFGFSIEHKGPIQGAWAIGKGILG